MYNALQKYRVTITIALTLLVIVVVTLFLVVNRQKTSYIYSPGLFGSPLLVGRYCPYHVAYTGETILGSRGGNIFGNGSTITTVIFSEIDTQKPHGWFNSTVKPWAMNKVFFSLFGISVRESSTPHAETVFNYIFHFKNVNIGQEPDIALLRSSYAQHVKNYPSTRIIMFGDSRGAATTFNFIAEDHPPIAGAVIEGIFDTIPHLIKHCFVRGSKGSLIEWSLKGLLTSCAGKYKQDGPFPADYVEKFPHNTPTLLITSQKDELVSLQCTIRLYRLLRKTGHNNVHLLVLPTSHHPFYMVGKDREMYESCVHAFYQHCGVEYDPAQAERGRPIFAQTQPTDDELTQKYRIYRKCCSIDVTP